MPIKATRSTKRVSLNLRIRPVDRSLIERAAQLAGKTRTDFVIEAARRAAEDTLLDLSRKLHRLEIGELPVVDPAGRPVGLLDVQDLLSARLLG